MPITFDCECGKTLRVKDELAGKRVRCPACSGAATVPAAEPQFEVVDDDPGFEAVPEPPPRKPAPIRARPVARPADEDDDRPRSRRRDEEDDEDDRPRRKPPKKKKAKKPAEHAGHFALEKGILNGGVGIGILVMIGSVIWLVVGLMNDLFFYYSPVLFVIGLIATIKGLVGGGDE